ncbi:MAG: LapA family protein [Caldimonas sp.]
MMRTLFWIVRAAVFLALFAFALNNLEQVEINGFFQQKWKAPMIFIVLAAFGIGCAFGIFAMVPSWWRQRRLSRTQTRRAGDQAVVAAPTAPATESAERYPSRDGL